MIKTVINISIIALMAISCSPKKEATVAKKPERVKEKVYKKTLFINTEYKINNLTLKEDVQLLTSDDLSLYNTFFEEGLQYSLKEKGFELVKTSAESNYQIEITNFSLKEFKLQVDGPSVNVAHSEISYNFVTPTNKTILVDAISKESIEPFEGFVFQDLVNELSIKLANKIEGKVK